MTGPDHACSGGSYSAVEQAHTLRGVALGLSWNDIYLSGMEAGVWGGGMAGRSMGAVITMWRMQLGHSPEGRRASAARSACASAAAGRRAAAALAFRAEVDEGEEERAAAQAMPSQRSSDAFISAVAAVQQQQQAQAT